jgi:hypothetical protein
MHRSSETIGNISGALAKAQVELTNPGEVASRDHPVPFPAGGRSHLPLCPAVERVGHCPQNAWPARDRRDPVDEYR